MHAHREKNPSLWLAAIFFAGRNTSALPPHLSVCLPTNAPLTCLPASIFFLFIFHTLLLAATPPLQDHEWITVEGDIGTIGITNHAQEQLGDVVYVDLPDVGSSVEKDETMGAVESVKAASDIYSPVSGEVVEINEALNDDPSNVNSAAETDGWMVKIKL